MESKEVGIVLVTKALKVQQVGIPRNGDGDGDSELQNPRVMH
jgi:hypothetical protein